MLSTNAFFCGVLLNWVDLQPSSLPLARDTVLQCLPEHFNCTFLMFVWLVENKFFINDDDTVTKVSKPDLN